LLTENEAQTINELHGDGYFFVYTVTLIGTYHFELVVNGETHATVYELEVLSTDIDLDISQLQMLGYKHKSSDCMFAQAEAYLTIDMLDKHGN
jgi:hypothetical protein